MRKPPVRLTLLGVMFNGMLGLSACAVGPDFHTPAPPATQAYTPTPLPDRTVESVGPAGASQRLLPASTVQADWWTLFHCEPLDRLVREGLERSPSVHAAAHALRAAQATLDAETASLFFPRIDASAGATRQRVPAAEFGSANGPAAIYNLYTASVAVSYKPDVFGGARRTAEAYRAQVDYERYELEAAYLTLSSNLVTTAISEASYRAQLAAVSDIVASQRSTLKVVERQFESGATSKADLLAQRTQLAATEAQLPPLEKALAQTRHRLAVLVGDSPSRPDLPEFELTAFTLPAELPVSLPSELVRNRPDIQASEAQLHVASADVGIATANLYPQITLTASAGGDSTALGDLFKPGARAWALGGSITQPVFHAGELRAQRRAAQARYDGALDAYQSTVLASFQQVADSLRAIEWDAKALQAVANSEALAKESLGLSERQYAVGGVSYLTLLNAQRQYFDARRTRVQAEALRFADTAALYAALGGGWWNRTAASP